MKPRIHVGGGPQTIRALIEAIDSNQIPGTYVTSGRAVHVEQVSGSPTMIAGDEDSPLPVAASEVKPPALAALLAQHTEVYKTRHGKDKDGNPVTYDEEVTPPAAQLAAALAPKNWPRLRPLYGIAGAPLLRPDGTLLQTPGYDAATGLYLASKVPLDHVPDHPKPDQVKAARAFLLDEFLCDFPWEDESDQANYLGMFATPILRRYLRTLIPFFAITATMPSSGKTILTSGLGMLYGQRVLTWPDDDDAELRKAITAVMADPVGTVIFDNLAEGTVIRSPVLARLLTDRTWADRLLSTNVTASYANDRLWMATGNNLRTGGDMATRTVMSRLNPDMPRPEERTGFKVPDLDQWILSQANQRQVLWNLLILVIDWTASGAPRKHGVAMRQFTPWAEAIGGFLDHHSVKGFLGNAESVRGADDDDAAWTSFLAQWQKVCGDLWLTSHELCVSADYLSGFDDPWEGLFFKDSRGRNATERSVGKRLAGQVGRWRGSYVLRTMSDLHTKASMWRVEERPA